MLNSMKKTLRHIFNYLILGTVGGIIYQLMEVVFKSSIGDVNQISWTMVLVGGVAFIVSGSINNVFPWDMPFWLQLVLSATTITTIEFISGVIINVWLKMNVWDYSDKWGNILGQICPEWWGVWFLLSIPAILLADQIQWRLGEGPKPYYTMLFAKSTLL